MKKKDSFVIGEAGLLNALYDVGITMNDVNPDYVVVGEGRSYSLDTLTKATNLVLKGAKLIWSYDVLQPQELILIIQSYIAGTISTDIWSKLFSKSFVICSCILLKSLILTISFLLLT